MTIDTNAIVSMTEANQNFSRVTRIAEQKGQAVIFKNNRPKYLLLDLDNAPLLPGVGQMIRFSKEKVLLLHQLMAEATGGSTGLREEALLESALESVYATFGGQELYPSKEEKAARLGYNLVTNHAFVDGNKRIGMYVMLTFLEANGIRLSASNQEVFEMGMRLADGSAGYEALLAWVRAHRI